MRPSRALCVLAAFVIASSLGLAQDDRPRDTRRQWNKLSAESKKELKKRFESFRNLPPEQQDRFRKRHRELLRLRRKVTEDLKDELTGLPSEERKLLIDRMVEEELRDIEAKVKKKKIVEQEPPKDSKGHRKKRMRRELERRNRDLSSRLLRTMRAKGAITEQERRRIESLGHEEKVAEILNLRKRQFLHSVEDCVPPEDFNRFDRMSWRPFREEIDRQRREKGLFGKLAKICELTPEQGEKLEQIESKKEREQMKRLFFDENFQRHFKAMGVSDEQIDELLSQPMPRRMQAIMKVLRDIPPEKVPPHLRDLLRRPAQADELDRRGRGTRRPFF